MTTTAIIQCGSKKLDVASPAKDLYVGALFKMARRVAEANYDRWFIVSARHGIIAPDDIIEPYDLVLDVMTSIGREMWRSKVRGQIRRLHIEGATVLAAKAYCRPFEGMGATFPLDGTSLFDRMKLMRQAIEEGSF